jgi:poly(3-hydroxybutyrate) depolymerase
MGNRSRWIWVVLFGLGLGCGDDTEPGDDVPGDGDVAVEADGEAGADGDADADGDVDTGPEAGADADAGTDAAVPPSPGCGLAATLAAATWTERSISVGGAARSYFVWLPEAYDPFRPYPVVYQLHGCSGSATREDNNVPVQRESGAEAIHVRGRAAADCWDAAADGPDVAFFDAMVAAVEAELCADPERRFVTGYSSGSFMAHQLACLRGAELRAVATIAGGQAGRSCTGDPAALLIHDDTDGTVGIDASLRARDDHRTRNGCDPEAAPVPFDPDPCVAYVGCDPRLPVVWCQTTGQGHSRQDDLAAPAFWRFLSSLPR